MLIAIFMITLFARLQIRVCILKIPKGQSEAVKRRKDNAKDKRTNNDLQNITQKT